MILIKWRNRRYNFPQGQLNRYAYNRIWISDDKFEYHNFFLGCEPSGYNEARIQTFTKNNLI